MSGLTPNTLYDKISLTYYPYLTNPNVKVRTYNESISIPKNFTSSQGVQFSSVVTIQKNTTRTYTLSLVNTGTKTSGVFTPSTSNNTYDIVIDLTNNTASDQPYISNNTSLQGGVYNYSGTGLLYVPVGASYISQNNDGAVISFSISNLEEGATYNPKAYLQSKSNINNKSNIISTPDFTIDIMPYSISTGPLSTNLTRTLTSALNIKDFNIYDRLINTNYNLPNKSGGNMFIFDVKQSDLDDYVTPNNKNYGTLALDTLASYPRSISIPLNKPINTNTNYTFYAGYNPLPHSVTGWNQYSITGDTRGERNLFKNVGATRIAFLTDTMIPTTGLTTQQSLALCSMLGHDIAVIYGSFIMYTYKSNIPGQASDLDIMVKDKNVLKQIVDFIVSASSNTATVYDYFQLYPSSTVGITNYLTSQVPDTTNITTLVSSYKIQNNSSTMSGPFNTSFIANPSTNVNPQMDGIYKAITIKIGSSVPIQIVFIEPRSIPENFTLSEYAQYSSDFTVNAGTYDGSNMIIPYYRDIDEGIAVYRDIISDNRKWRTISRLRKYIDRNFTIFFESESQVNEWNSFKAGVSDFDPWWTAASQVTPKPLDSCPFRVLNRISLLAFSNRTIKINTVNNQEMIKYTKITSTTQPSFGGSLLISGFDYVKYGVYSIPSFLGGSLSVVSSTTNSLFGTIGLTGGIYPRDINILMNKEYIPTGSTGISLIYTYDNPTIVADMTQANVYNTIDTTLILSTVTPLIHNIVVQIPSGTTFGGLPLSVTQPLVQIKAVPVSKLMYEGGYSAGITYVTQESLVSDSDTLYRLMNTSTGDPLHGNGWIDITNRYLNFKGNWYVDVEYNEGNVVNYDGTLYSCTMNGTINQTPGEIDINTGLSNNWISDINTRYTQSNYSSPEYKLVITNCIPNTE